MYMHTHNTQPHPQTQSHAYLFPLLSKLSLRWCANQMSWRQKDYYYHLRTIQIVSCFKRFYPSLDAAVTTQPQQGQAKILTATVGYLFNFNIKIIKEQSYWATKLFTLK